MKTTWQRLLGMAVLSTALAHCFSSSSGAGGDSGTCSAFVQSASSSACGTCVQSKCSGQIAAAEQPCADFVTCICSSDGTAESCASKLQESSCQTSANAVEACEQNNCATQCAGVDASSSGTDATAPETGGQDAGMDSTVESGPEAAVDGGSSSGADSSMAIDEGTIEDSSMAPDTFVADVVVAEAAPEAAAEGGTDAGCPVAGQTSCAGTCTNTQTDNANCGTCGNACSGGETCQSGTCLCPTGQTFCNAACTNTATDNSNCGMCGNACKSGQVCSGGTCGTVCAPPTTTCGTTCTNLQIDPNNCGKCSDVCGPFQNAAPGCDQGSCVYSCNQGFLDCKSSTGCEINGQIDLNNCGACGAVCGLGNDAPVCAGGACSLNCNAGYLSCDGNNANGCEDNVANDALNCGTCKKVCPGGFLNATPSCAASTCGFTCTSPWQDCDGSKTGCDSNSQSDTSNCGQCGNACQTTKGYNQVPTCNGTCGTACATGFAHCNAQFPAADCETSLTTNANCGGCGNACGVFTEVDGGLSGNPDCSTGTCQLNCIANWASCDGNNANGCETETDDNNQHCGNCTTVCGPGTFCAGGTCLTPPPPPP